MRLFTVAKVPMYCEGITHRIERRKSGDTKVVDLALRIEPFTTQLASALDPSYGFVRRMLFSMNNAEPVTELKAVEFKVPGERQQLTCFAAPDVSVASIALSQVKITKIRARKPKEGTAWVVYVYASFGPLGKDELEYINRFYTTQAFITFEQADPTLFEGDVEPADAEDDDEDAEPGGEGAHVLSITGICTHGARVGQSCETCDGGIALAPPPPPQDERDHARPAARRHPRGTPRPQAPRSPRITH